MKLKADQFIQQAVASAGTLTESDRALLHALVIGTLRRWFKLNHWMQTLTNRPLKVIEPKTRTLLRLGLFQLSDLSHVPAYAAIDTTVNLAKQQKVSPKTVKFINAVLREAQRRLEADGFSVPEAHTDFSGHLLAQYGWPPAWVQRLENQYDQETIIAMAQASQQPAPLTLRVNTLCTTMADYQRALQAANIPFEPLPDMPEGLLLPGFSGSPRQLPGYDEGWFYIQDPASMAVSHWLDPQPDETILDLCAAPGSKTTHIAALINNTGSITAIEPQTERIKHLQDNLDRLGVTNTTIFAVDGLAFQPNNAYDRVLVDAPCSGSGTLRRHPEILLQSARLDLKRYARLQSQLLTKGFSCLKPGGVLVYSTCSILRAENQEVIQDFLARHTNARLDSEQQRLITQNADGFYTARILKKA